MFYKHTCNRNSLFLSARKRYATLSNNGFITVCKTVNRTVYTGNLTCLTNIIKC